ncbi:hypothetical protein CF113_11820 [Aeromonas veronii]|nr:hypothetical protein CF113_11820 [Aeromonas veronii]
MRWRQRTITHKLATEAQIFNRRRHAGRLRRTLNHPSILLRGIGCHAGTWIHQLPFQWNDGTPFEIMAATHEPLPLIGWHITDRVELARP